MDVQAEHDAVDRIDFKILGVANNEVKLARVLNQHLTPLLLAAQSPHAAVRAKVSCPSWRDTERASHSPSMDRRAHVLQVSLD